MLAKFSPHSNILDTTDMHTIPINCSDLIAHLEGQAESQRFVQETFKNINPHISAKYKRKVADTEDLIITVHEKMHSGTYKSSGHEKG